VRSAEGRAYRVLDDLSSRALADPIPCIPTDEYTSVHGPFPYNEHGERVRRGTLTSRQQVWMEVGRGVEQAVISRLLGEMRAYKSGVNKQCVIAVSSGMC